jgi:hypothetical protein
MPGPSSPWASRANVLFTSFKPTFPPPHHLKPAATSKARRSFFEAGFVRRLSLREKACSSAKFELPSVVSAIAPPLSSKASPFTDAVRCAKLALDRGIGAAFEALSGYFMRSPPRQLTDDETQR